MKNDIKIYSDGICLFIVSKIIADRLGIAILLICNSLILSLLIAGIFYGGDKEYVGAKIFCILIGLPFYIGTLGRYTAWNIWGEERIIINTKSVSYQCSYGIVTPRMSTKTYKHLSIIKLLSYRINNDIYGELIFRDYNENNLPYELFRSAIPIKKSDLDLIDKKVSELYLKEFYRENKFIPYSIN